MSLDFPSSATTFTMQVVAHRAPDVPGLPVRSSHLHHAGNCPTGAGLGSSCEALSLSFLTDCHDLAEPLQPNSDVSIGQAHHIKRVAVAIGRPCSPTCVVTMATEAQRERRSSPSMTSQTATLTSRSDRGRGRPLDAPTLCSRPSTRAPDGHREAQLEHGDIAAGLAIDGTGGRSGGATDARF